MDNEYSTSDLYEASALVSMGVELLRLDSPVHGNRWNFVFAQSQELDNVVNDFLNGRLIGNIRNFLSTWRQLRRRIDQEEMRNGKRSSRN
jgi:hypothetical protein